MQQFWDSVIHPLLEKRQPKTEQSAAAAAVTVNEKERDAMAQEWQTIKEGRDMLELECATLIKEREKWFLARKILLDDVQREKRELEHDRAALDLHWSQVVLERQTLRVKTEEAHRTIDAAKHLKSETEKTLAFAHEEQQKLHQNLLELRKNFNETTAHLEHLLSTKSWRYTLWLRKLEATARAVTSGRIAYTVFGALKDIWTDFGEPYPTFVRWVRHDVLGDIWPVHKPEYDPGNTDSRLRDKSNNTVAVVIPCHNYGAYLGDAIDSVFSQTVLPIEVVVVDDGSTDNTEEIAKHNTYRGVRYIRGEWQSVGAARNAGLDATEAEFLIFLDADDMLHARYIEASLDAIRLLPNGGLAYTDQQYFGTQNAYHTTPEHFDWRKFDADNHISATAMVRRNALLQAGKFSHGVNQAGDWVTWRRVLRLGWKAVKSRGLLFYRQHSKSMTHDLRANRIYPKLAGFFEEPVTLCIALSGRAWMWPKTAKFLEDQTFPHLLTELIVLDTSGDPAFGTMVRDWLSRCDYHGFTYLEEPICIAHLADMPRESYRREVSEVCARMYNRFARLATTTLVFFLEDDIVPPLDAYPRLIASFDIPVVSVSGFYTHRESGIPVAWTWSDDGTKHPHFSQGDGILEVGGNGFGCVVIRGERLRNTVFHSGPPTMNFDQNFYHQVVWQEKQKAMIDHTVECAHLSAPEES